jgi:signal transduction histidine kinase
MKQVFMNLIKNAGEAMPDGGTITFRTKSYATPRKKRPMLRIELSDTGTGISKENQKRLFTPELFSTKEEGYGLGLFIVASIIKRHGGKINIKSELGKGTTFILSLPTGLGR